MAHQYLHLTPMKGKDAVASAGRQINHDLRMYDVSNADRGITKENEILIINENLVKINDGSSVKEYDFFGKSPAEIKSETTANFAECFSAHVKEHCGQDYTVRSNAIKVIEVLMTTSPDVDKNFDRDKWTEDSMKWAEKEFGKENITLAVLHKDEHTPHIHLQFIPVKDGRLNGTYYTGRSSALKRLQRSYAEVTKKHGLRHRDKHPRISHEDIKHFYDRMSEAMNTDVPERERLESDKQYRERLSKWANDFKMSIFAHAEKLSREAKEDLKDAREYRKEVDDMEVRVRQRSIETNLHERQYKAMEALQYMVKKDFFDFEELERMRRAMRIGMKELEKMSEREKTAFFAKDCKEAAKDPEREIYEPQNEQPNISEEYDYDR